MSNDENTLIRGSSPLARTPFVLINGINAIVIFKSFLKLFA
jgi:hypothetical protein